MSESSSYHGRGSCDPSGTPEASLPGQHQEGAQPAECGSDSDDDPEHEHERDLGVVSTAQRGNARQSPARRAKAPCASQSSEQSSRTTKGAGNGSLPISSIDLESGEPAAVSPEWATRKTAKKATRGGTRIGRLLGFATFTILCTETVRKKLASPFEAKHRGGTKGTPSQMVPWDSNGEFCTDRDGHIPISRLVKSLRKGHATCSAPKDGLCFLEHILTLQSPRTSPWKCPLLRALSTQSITPKGDGMKVKYYIYASRLLMELVADHDVMAMMKMLTPVGEVTSVTTIENQPVQFLSSASSSTPQASQSIEHAEGPSGEGCSTTTDHSNSSADAAKSRDASDFSLEGVLKLAESTGYVFKSPQPLGLRVTLYDFQRSTLQWMVDRERDARGLNGFFWEKRELTDGGSPVWYFPLGGEFRLSEPPRVTGGLLCEDMGMGKTIEVLSTVLSNPRDGGAHRSPQHRSMLRARSSTCKDPEGRVVSRATLIIVPTSLLNQWTQEIKNSVEPRSLRTMIFTGTQSNKVPVSHVEFTGPAKRTKGTGVVRRCTAPYFEPGESMEEAWSQKGCVELTKEEAQRVEQWKAGHADIVPGQSPIRRQSSLGNGNVPGAAGSGRIMTVKGSPDDETPAVKVNYNVDEWLLADNDVVLTTYKTLRSQTSLFNKVNFHRCVVDECQALKSGTSNIAIMCQRIEARNRWMVSGTPLTRHIGDLHGELNFLQVWPFSLQKDGFWERKVQRPFERHERSALDLIKHLLKVVMMRHSKSQRHVDGRALVNLPARTVEWRGLDFNVAGPSTNPAQNAWYVSMYLERLCAEAHNALQGLAGDKDEAEYRRTMKLKNLVATVQKSISHVGTVSLDEINDLERHVRDARFQTADSNGVKLHNKMEAQTAIAAYDIRAVSPEEILQKLAPPEADGSSSRNREDKRRIREALGNMPISELRSRIEAFKLPLPRSWVIIRQPGTISRGSRDLNLHGHTDAPEVMDVEMANVQEAVSDGKSWGPKRKGKKRIVNKNFTRVDMRKVLKVSDTVRVGVNHHSNEVTIESMKDSTATLAKEWKRNTVARRCIYRSVISERKEPYVDLLMAKVMELQIDNGHETGFSGIYAAIAGKPNECSICLSIMERPTVAPCGHMFCRECIASALSQAARVGLAPTCPMCRRKLESYDVREMWLANGVEDLEMHDIASSGPGASKSAGGDGKGVASLTAGGNVHNGSRRSGMESVLYGGEGQVSPSSDMISDIAEDGPGGGDGSAAFSGDSSSRFVIPEFQCKEMACEAELRGIPDPAVMISANKKRRYLGSRLLSQYAAATRSNSSVKIDAMMRDMELTLARDPSSKFVIFTHYSEVVAKVKGALDSRGIKSTDIFGTRSRAERSAAVSAFMNNESVKAIVLTTGTAAAGLTLTAASTVYMLEPSLNPAEEAQALSRTHRIGQNLPVRCIVYYMRDSVDERILALRAEKGNFAAFLADGPGMTSCSKSTEPSTMMQSGNWFQRLLGMESTSTGDLPDESLLDDGSSQESDEFELEE